MQDTVGADGLHEIVLDDRLTLRYRKVGSGPPLVLMHTIRTQLEYFREVVPHLQNLFTVYVVDLPGHGRSRIDRSAPYDEPYFRNAMRRFVEQLGLTDVTLAGESIGAVLALTVASELGTRVRAVVASNPYDYDTRYGDGVRRGNLFANAVIGSFGLPVVGVVNATLENPIFLGIILRGGLHDKSKLPRDLLWQFDSTGRRRGYRTMERRVFAKWRSWGEARSRYEGVKAPVRVVYGASDWSRMPERQRTVAAIPGARMITLAETGHFASLERPRELADIIIEAGLGP